MATWETKTTVMGGPEDVLAVLTDPCAARRWSPIGFELEQIEGDRLRSGTHAVLSGKLAGRSVKFEVDVIKAGDGRLELRATGPVEMDVRYDAAALGEMTEVVASVVVRSAGGLMGRLISSATDALLAGGALNIAVQSVAREVEQSVAYATAA
jgi:Polyketide cyclase / dehydrase and lipid transport